MTTNHHASRPPRLLFAAHVGQQLRSLRVRRGLSQRELASRAGVEPHTLSKYEGGVHSPPLKRVWALARTLSLPVDCFLPPLDFPDPDDRVLYDNFRKIWFAPRAARAIAARNLSACLDELQPPPGGPHAPHN